MKAYENDSSPKAYLCWYAFYWLYVFHCVALYPFRGMGSWFTPSRLLSPYPSFPALYCQDTSYTWRLATDATIYMSHLVFAMRKGWPCRLSRHGINDRISIFPPMNAVTSGQRILKDSVVSSSMWPYAAVSGNIWQYLVISGRIWQYLAASAVSGSIWQYLTYLAVAGSI